MIAEMWMKFAERLNKNKANKIFERITGQKVKLSEVT